MNTIQKERNGVTMEASVVSIGRGPAKGQPYLAFIPTVENISDYIKFVGEKAIVDILQRSAKADGQDALNIVLGDEGWNAVTVTDPETKKEVVVETYNQEAVDWSKVIDTIFSGAVKGGITSKQLRDEREELFRQMTSLYQSASGDSMTSEDKAKAFTEGLGIAAKIAELDAAIEAKKRIRRSNPQQDND